MIRQLVWDRSVGAEVRDMFAGKNVPIGWEDELSIQRTTSVRVGLPAELKHISQQRKRNQQEFPE